MLVILLGARCSGKDTIAKYLTDAQGFQRVHLSSQIHSRASSSYETRSEPPNASSSTQAAHIQFQTPSDFLDYATLHWRSHFVTTVRLSRHDLEAFRKRPWVLLVNVEAPLTWRFARSTARSRSLNEPELTLEDFIHQDDILVHGVAAATSNKGPSEPSRVSRLSSHLQLPSGPLPLPNPVPTPPTTPQLARTLANGLHVTEPLARTFTSQNEKTEGEDDFMPLVDAVPLVHLSIRPAAFETTEELGRHLEKLNLASEHRVRPSWDEYFMTLAELASLRSNCMKRRVGAVLISSKRKVVLSTGYNGTPRGMTNCAAGGCSRCNSTSILSKNSTTPVRSGVDMEECLCLHAEENALLEAGRERAGAGEGGTLYCNTCPCLRCTVKIVQCGVSEVVYSQSYSMDQSSAAVFQQAGVKLRQVALKRDLTQ